MDTYSKAQHTALSILTRRRHSREELRRKLTTRGFEARIVEKVLSECERLQYIDDETAADFFMEELLRKRIGLLRIKDAMKARGFDRDLTDRMIDEHRLPEREPELAAAAVEKKKAALNRETDHRKRREKVVRFLRSRGFRPSTISAVLDDMDP
jgi:regulatory protein